MSRVGLIVTGILIILMAGIEVVEGHGRQVAMIISGLVSLFVWSRCSDVRPLVRILCAGLALGIFFVVGLIHWCDGQTELIDGLSLGVVVLLSIMVLGGVRWRERKMAASGRPKLPTS